jgi:hypothetical protein
MARFWSVLRRAHFRPSRTIEVNPAIAYGACLAEIELLVEAERSLALEIIRDRAAGKHLSLDEHRALRQAHRVGLALRQRCNDPILDGELGWLQALTVQAAMVDPDELDPVALERSLDQRVREVQEMIAMRRRQLERAS